jgi:hypothetical protein
MALLFSTTVVAFAIVGELTDIELCPISLNNAAGQAKVGARLAVAFERHQALGFLAVLDHHNRCACMEPRR